MCWIYLFRIISISKLGYVSFKLLSILKESLFFFLIKLNFKLKNLKKKEKKKKESLFKTIEIEDIA